jgi:hypothetical protein
VVYIRKYHQIYNENLTTSFINQWRTISQRARANSEIFAHEGWRKKGVNADV